MSRSSPAAPGYLQGAIRQVEAVLRDHYPRPLTTWQLVGELQKSGYQWPLRNRYGRGYREDEYGVPTPERVARICRMTGNKTRIMRATPKDDKHGNPPLSPAHYTLYPWATKDHT